MNLHWPLNASLGLSAIAEFLVIISKADYTSKRYLRFYRCHGSYMFDKICNLRFLFVVLCHFSCIDVSFYLLVYCTYFRFSKWRPFAIFVFIVSQLLLKIQIIACFYVDMQNLVKIGRSATNYCIFSIFKMAAVRHFGFSMAPYRTTAYLYLMVRSTF